MLAVGNEIAAMGQLDTALGELDDDERARVLAWAVSKFGGGTVKLPTGLDARADDPLIHDASSKAFERVSDLVDAANPSSGLDYVLLGSYWFQQIQGAESFTGQQVNTMLKDLGHGAANITSAYDSLKGRKPPLARQIQKKGTSKQARKQYRLTAEGVRAVERMLNRTSGDE